MSTYMTEEEQLKLIKEHWNRYGSHILTGFLIIALVWTGWQWWDRYQTKIATQASSLYEKLVVSDKANDATSIQAYANSLKQDYGSTPYAALAGLFLAKQAMLQHDDKKAREQLNWVKNNSKLTYIKELAMIRLARIAYSQQQYQAGLDELKTVKEDVLAPMAAQLRGDIYLAMGEKEEARMAYTLALQTTPKDVMDYAFVQMKLYDLADPDRHIDPREKESLS